MLRLRKHLTPIVALVLFGALSTLTKNSSPISWLPEKLEVSVFQSGTRTVSVSFVSKINLEDIDVFVVPEINKFLKTNPNKFTAITAGQKNNVELTFSIPKETPLDAFEGTVHLRSANRTIAKPLPIILKIISPQQAEQQLEELLIQKFGTTTPPVSEGEAFSVIEPTGELIDILAQGSNLPFVFKTNSPIRFVLNLNLEVSADVANAIGDFVPIVAAEGIRVQDIVNTLPAHRWHKEDLDEPLIPEGAVAITIRPPGSSYDRDGNGLIDTIVLVITDTTHSILGPEDVNNVVARNFTDASGIQQSALTAMHELIHVFGFRTQCGGGREWYTLSAEEDFVSQPQPSVEALIQDVFASKNTGILNSGVDGILAAFPNTKSCLESLDLTRPVPVVLNLPTNITTSTLSLSWSRNIDRDFASYKLFRSTSPSVTTNNILVATITDPNQTTFTDSGLTSNASLFYRVFVFDNAGLSSDSNEVSAKTLPVGNPPAAVSLDIRPQFTDAKTAVKWTQNTDPDFVSYNVVRDGQVIFSTADRNVICYIDENVPFALFSYSVKTTNLAGLSSFSNEAAGRKFASDEIISNIPNIPEPGAIFPPDFAIPVSVDPQSVRLFGCTGPFFVRLSTKLDSHGHVLKERKFNAFLNNLTINNQSNLKFNVHDEDVLTIIVTAQDQDYSIFVDDLGIFRSIPRGESRLVSVQVAPSGAFPVILRTATTENSAAGIINVLP